MKVLVYNQFLTKDGRLFRPRPVDYIRFCEGNYHFVIKSGYSFSLPWDAYFYTNGMPRQMKHFVEGSTPDIVTKQELTAMYEANGFRFDPQHYLLAHLFTSIIWAGPDCPTRAGGNAYLVYYEQASQREYQDLLLPRLESYGLDIKHVFSSPTAAYLEISADEALRPVTYEHHGIVDILRQSDYSQLLSFLFGCIDACAFIDPKNKLVLSYHHKVPARHSAAANKPLMGVLSERTLAYFYRGRIRKRNRHPAARSFYVLLDMLGLLYSRWNSQLHSGFAEARFCHFTQIPDDLLDALFEYSLFFNHRQDYIHRRIKLEAHLASPDDWQEYVRIVEAKKRHNYMKGGIKYGLVDQDMCPLYAFKIRVGA